MHDGISGGITAENITRAYRRTGWWGKGLMRVQIINGVLYAVPPESCPQSWRYNNCGAKRDWRRTKFTLSQLWTLTKLYSLPNVDFVFSTSDDAGISSPRNGDAPIFGWNSLAKTPEEGWVNIPYEVNGWHNYMPEELGVANKKKEELTKWSNRPKTAVWRGGPTGNVNWSRVAAGQAVSERGRVCVQSGEDAFQNSNPPLLDFAFVSDFVPPPTNILNKNDNGVDTNNNTVSTFPCRISKSARLSISEQQNQFRYILDLAGNGWSSRFLELLKLNVVVVKAKDRFTGFCQELAVAGVHYTSFNSTAKSGSPLSLLSVLRSLQNNDAQAEHMINDANAFVRDYCSRDAQICYWKLLLEEYAKLFISKTDTDLLTPHHLAIKIDRYPPLQLLEWELLLLLFGLLLLVCVCVRFDQLMLSKCAHNAVHTQDYTRGLQVHKYERVSTAMEDDGTCSSNMHNIQYSDTDNVNIEMLKLGV
jgi:hypothetical protein